MRSIVISEKKIITLQQRLHRLGIKEEDLEEKFILASGKGGQKIQKTSSCVYLKHLPSGIDVKCSQERPRELNRYLARKLLCDKFEEQFHPEKSRKLKNIEKIRKQKKRRKRRRLSEL